MIDRAAPTAEIAFISVQKHHGVEGIAFKRRKPLTAYNDFSARFREGSDQPKAATFLTQYYTDPTCTLRDHTLEGTDHEFNVD